jgi:hypothetical protein
VRGIIGVAIANGRLSNVRLVVANNFYDYMHDKYPEMVPKAEGDE